jgi:hypothetical protein
MVLLPLTERILEAKYFNSEFNMLHTSKVRQYNKFQEVAYNLRNSSETVEDLSNCLNQGYEIIKSGFIWSRLKYPK